MRKLPFPMRPQRTSLFYGCGQKSARDLRGIWHCEGNRSQILRAPIVLSRLRPRWQLPRARLGWLRRTRRWLWRPRWRLRSVRLAYRWHLFHRGLGPGGAFFLDFFAVFLTADFAFFAFFAFFAIC